MGQYKYHVFVCTSGSTCPMQGSVEVHAALKKGAAAAGLAGIVRVNHAGCMNQCGHGPMVVVYPEDVWYAGAAAPPPPSRAPEGLRVRGSAVVYRLYDVGYEIRLDRALDLLAASAPERVRPVRGEAQAIQIKDPPITVILGTESLVVGG